MKQKELESTLEKELLDKLVPLYQLLNLKNVDQSQIRNSWYYRREIYRHIEKLVADQSPENISQLNKIATYLRENDLTEFFIKFEQYRQSEREAEQQLQEMKHPLKTSLGRLTNKQSNVTDNISPMNVLNQTEKTPTQTEPEREI